MTCTRPGNLDVLDYKETIRLLEAALNRTNADLHKMTQENARLVAEVERLKDQVEMLTLDLAHRAS